MMSSERSAREGEGTVATVLRAPMDTRGGIVCHRTPEDTRAAPIVCHRTPAGAEDPAGPGAQPTILGSRGQEGPQGTILEDDQQLYDWGIENRLDQYTYQDDQSAGGNGAGEGYAYFPGGGAREYRSPPPAHGGRGYREQTIQGSSVHGPVKEEPGLDMTAWSHQTPGYQGFYRKLPTSPGSTYPSFSLDANEALKAERKRARNRVAASKCRMRKMEKIATLDHQTAQLRQENDDLAALAGKLREQVYKLQQELQWHVNNGCQMTMKRAGKIAELLTIPSTGTASTSPSSQGAQVVVSPDSTTAPPLQTQNSPNHPPETS